MHGLDVTSKGLRKISGMNVELQDGEDSGLAQVIVGFDLAEGNFSFVDCQELLEKASSP